MRRKYPQNGGSAADLQYADLRHTHRHTDLLQIRRVADLSAEIRRHFRFRCNEYILFSLCYLQTAGENDKTRISHVITTGQWRSAPQIRPAPHFVQSLNNIITKLQRSRPHCHAQQSRPNQQSAPTLTFLRMCITINLCVIMQSQLILCIISEIIP